MDETRVQEIIDLAINVVATKGLDVVGAVVILIVGRILSGVLSRATAKAMRKADAYEALIRFVSKLVGWAVMIFAIIAALNRFGVQTTSFVAVLGAAGFAVGLALQGSLSNFASGVLILIFRPFRIGDVVTAAGETGKVDDIGILTTILNTPDNKKIIIPNSEVMGGTITNVNAYDTRRVDLTAGIGYGDDIGKAKALFEDIVNSHEKVLQDPAPTVELVELADSSVNFVVRPWVKTEDYWTVYFDVTRSIKERCDEAGISIPFPQRDVHVFRETA